MAVSAAPADYYTKLQALTDHGGTVTAAPLGNLTPDDFAEGNYFGSGLARYSAGRMSTAEGGGGCCAAGVVGGADDTWVTPYVGGVDPAALVGGQDTPYGTGAGPDSGLATDGAGETVVGWGGNVEPYDANPDEAMCVWIDPLPAAGGGSDPATLLQSYSSVSDPNAALTGVTGTAEANVSADALFVDDDGPTVTSLTYGIRGDAGTISGGTQSRTIAADHLVVNVDNIDGAYSFICVIWRADTNTIELDYDGSQADSFEPTGGRTPGAAQAMIVGAPYDGEANSDGFGLGSQDGYQGYIWGATALTGEAAEQLDQPGTFTYQTRCYDLYVHSGGNDTPGLNPVGLPTGSGPGVGHSCPAGQSVSPIEHQCKYLLGDIPVPTCDDFDTGWDIGADIHWLACSIGAALATVANAFIDNVINGLVDFIEPSQLIVKPWSDFSADLHTRVPFSYLPAIISQLNTVIGVTGVSTTIDLHVAGVNTHTQTLVELLAPLQSVRPWLAAMVYVGFAASAFSSLRVVLGMRAEAEDDNTEGDA